MLHFENDITYIAVLNDMAKNKCIYNLICARLPSFSCFWTLMKLGGGGGGVDNISLCDLVL